LHLPCSCVVQWALIELCRRPELQKKLRDELRAAHPSSDPTFDELSQGLPMLDAIVHETLRLHPAVPETVRMVCAPPTAGDTPLKHMQPAHDDILPLSTPLVLSDGQTTDHVVIQAKQSVAIPISAINRMPALWGPDAREFKPERWLDSGAGIPAAAKEVQGHRHLVTFIDGPRKYGAPFTHQ
jgi:cytochrome P450